MIRKHILGLKDMNPEEIQDILDTAHLMRPILESRNKKIIYLQGKNVLTLFYEASTRTRLSFELAAKYLGATTSNVSIATSSVNKGESLIDTVRTIQSMGVDIVVMRHPMTGAAKILSENLKANVINAGDGINEHPSQALLDIYTIQKHKGRIKDLKIVIAGDIMHSRVARSNIWGLTKLGARVVVAGPATLIPKEVKKMGVEISHNIKNAVKDADVIIALRVQKERQNSGLFPSLREYHKYFGIDDQVLSCAKTDALLMHPGPVNRGVEITSSIMDGKQSVVEEQVTNGLAIRMALLYLMTRGGDFHEQTLN